jgi:hypothetical protein
MRNNDILLIYFNVNYIFFDTVPYTLTKDIESYLLSLLSKNLFHLYLKTPCLMKIKLKPCNSYGIGHSINTHLSA